MREILLPFCKAPFKTFGCFRNHLNIKHEFDDNISHINQYPKLELSVIEDINLIWLKCIFKNYRSIVFFGC